MKAYILISTRNGEATAVVRQAKRIKGVVEAHITFGPYDVVAVVKATDTKEVGHIVHNEVQPIPGVLDTLTCLAVD
ncbi:MAG: Lrp/AsnC ligand binding domain-containing protein [Anaerolineae bacterium]|jgi:DNA-binding Lrp family transcriptional regulator|nr:Lrp/AsnC ligand binding domain-containing protein [Anaerolineae bacterium]MBT7074568.1 Lrp/AsnC ligand binding domain-containing protein [Anaerolineae bacterium]MBT7783010.1 Lrp/AsnC ligand binding domain-containing protein [Anaerolineae bacterium]